MWLVMRCGVRVIAVEGDEGAYVVGSVGRCGIRVIAVEGDGGAYVVGSVGRCGVVEGGEGAYVVW